VLRVLGHPDGLQPLGDGAEGDTLRAAGAGQADGDPGGHGEVRNRAGTGGAKRVPKGEGAKMVRKLKDAKSNAEMKQSPNDAEMQR